MSTRRDPQSPDERDEQQALLLAALRCAGGAPVSYRQLRDLGIEYPASVVSEQELAGLPLERRFNSAPASGSPGVRLDPRSDPGHDIAGRRGEAQLLASPARPSSTARVSPRGRPERWLAPAALVAVGATLAAFVVGGPGHARRAAAHRSSAERSVVGDIRPANRPPAAATRAARSSAPQPAPAQPQPTSVPVTQASPALAAELEARGHQLLEAGEPNDALPELRQALAATGETLAGCLEPTSQACLTYAYALYDLGRALLLARHPTAAVPILERRLQIANQRATVQSELQLARQAAQAPA